MYIFVLSVIHVFRWSICAAGGAGDEATEEGEVIPPTQENNVDMPPGEVTEEVESPTQEDVNVDMPPAEDTAAESSNVKQQATSASEVMMFTASDSIKRKW